MISPDQLATETVAVLAPYVAKAGGEIAKRFGGAVAEKLGGIYQRLKEKLVSPGEQEALSDFEQNPGDADSGAALRLKLKKLFERDGELRRELADLVQDPALKVVAQQTVSITGDNNAVAQVSGSGNVTIGMKSD